MNHLKPLVLVVDDKPNLLRLMTKVLGKEARVITADSGSGAKEQICKHEIDVILCDLRMPDTDGLDVLRCAREKQPNSEFILMTAYASVSSAVEAMRLGAYDYLTKPFDPDTARAVVRRALGRASTPLATGAGTADSTRPEVLPGLIARSQIMQELATTVTQVAQSESTVLLLGETGTGKERVARALHQLGARANRRFVAVNCAAVPAELLESELFGYAKGAFTGAGGQHAGLFEEADQGTLFLDEIAELRPSLQAKLTRALEERAVRRLGESHERPLDVRLIAATHNNLDNMVRSGAFREDLFYRLNVAAIHLPPLRERNSDISLLASYFLRERPPIQGKRLRGFTDQALQVMENYNWPGNVRQLRAAVERAGIMAAGERIDFQDLPPELRADTDSHGAGQDWSALTWAEALERGRLEVGRRYLRGVLKRFDGKVSAAAAHADIERESFYRLLRRYDVAH